MATNPAPKGRRKYCPVNEAPEPAVMRERSPTSFETPQLKTIGYRGKYTPGNESTYETRQMAQRDPRRTGGNV